MKTLTVAFSAAVIVLGAHRHYMRYKSMRSDLLIKSVNQALAGDGTLRIPA